eukprot:s2851_g11.t1
MASIGILNFLENGVFGRVGCGGLRAIKEHQYGSRRQLGAAGHEYRGGFCDLTREGPGYLIRWSVTLCSLKNHLGPGACVNGCSGACGMTHGMMGMRPGMPGMAGNPMMMMQMMMNMMNTQQMIANGGDKNNPMAAMMSCMGAMGMPNAMAAAPAAEEPKVCSAAPVICTEVVLERPLDEAGKSAETCAAEPEAGFPPLASLDCAPEAPAGQLEVAAHQELAEKLAAKNVQVGVQPTPAAALQDKRRAWQGKGGGPRVPKTPAAVVRKGGALPAPQTPAGCVAEPTVIPVDMDEQVSSTTEIVAVPTGAPGEASENPQPERMESQPSMPSGRLTAVPDPGSNNYALVPAGTFPMQMGVPPGAPFPGGTEAGPMRKVASESHELAPEEAERQVEDMASTQIDSATGQPIEPEVSEEALAWQQAQAQMALAAEADAKLLLPEHLRPKPVLIRVPHYDTVSWEVHEDHTQYEIGKLQDRIEGVNQWSKGNGKGAEIVKEDDEDLPWAGVENVEREGDDLKMAKKESNEESKAKEEESDEEDSEASGKGKKNSRSKSKKDKDKKKKDKKEKKDKKNKKNAKGAKKKDNAPAPKRKAAAKLKAKAEGKEESNEESKAKEEEVAEKESDEEDSEASGKGKKDSRSKSKKEKDKKKKDKKEKKDKRNKKNAKGAKKKDNAPAPKRKAAATPKAKAKAFGEKKSKKDQGE